MSNEKTLAAKVREASAENPAMTAEEIAKMIGIKKSYVHTVWYMDRKKGRKATVRRMGRPRKTAQERTIAPVTLEAIKKVNESLNDGRVQKLEAKVQELNTVIKYLEGRLYGASV